MEIHGAQISPMPHLQDSTRQPKFANMHSTLSYEPLNAQMRQIRLITVQAHHQGLVNCSLETISLNNPPPFAALSYVWNDPYNRGESPKNEKILVNGAIRDVPYNLARALVYLEGHWRNYFKEKSGDSPVFRLWADSICINQDSISERNDQVAEMRAIYSSAALVMAWLAPNDDRIPLAFNTLEIIHEEIIATAAWRESVLQEREWDPAVLSVVDELKGFAWMRKHPSLSEDGSDDQLGCNRWQSIMDLTTLHYWKRVWILQEAVLAKDLVYLSPSAAISGSIFELASECFFETLTKSLMTARPQFISPHTWNYMVTKLEKAPPPAWLINSFKTDLESVQSLPAHMISSFAPDPLRATDSRDYVYGLLGLMQLAIVPDYNNQVAEVYCDFVAACIKKTRNSGSPYLNLAVSSLPTSNTALQLPSWAPDLSANRVHSPFYLAIAAAESTNWGTASDSLFSSSTPDAEVVGRGLFVTGIAWETVTTLSEVLDRKEILGNDNAQSSESQDVSAELGPIARFLQKVYGGPVHTQGVGFWPSIVKVLRMATMVEQWPFHDDLAYSIIYVTRNLQLRLPLPRGNGVEASESVRRHSLNILRACFPDSECWSRLEDCVNHFSSEMARGSQREERIEAMILKMRTECDRWHKTARLFQTQTGHIGLAPMDTQAGDILCILHRCMQPAVLRKVSDHYVLVGTYLIPGIINDESRSYMETSEIKRFQLR